jgi:DNA-binding NtrC family response regulator
MMLPENEIAAKTQVCLKDMMAEYERALIVQALVGSAGHQRRAAAILGILPTTLHEKMKRLGIPTRTGLLREEYRKPGEAASETAAA